MAVCIANPSRPSSATRCSSEFIFQIVVFSPFDYHSWSGWQWFAHDRLSGTFTSICGPGSTQGQAARVQNPSLFLHFPGYWITVPLASTLHTSSWCFDQVFIHGTEVLTIKLQKKVHLVFSQVTDTSTFIEHDLSIAIWAVVKVFYPSAPRTSFLSQAYSTVNSRTLIL